MNQAIYHHSAAVKSTDQLLESRNGSSVSSASFILEEATKKTILCVVGTRPEVIKMAPLVMALRARGMNVPILASAQHRKLLDQMMEGFGLAPTWDLDAMRPGQDLAHLTGRLIPAMADIFKSAAPEAVLAQGDTTTVFCAALAAYYSGIPFGHVEAGLRSGDLQAPFPEEGMRRLSAVLTRWHFAPTERARKALLGEGHPGENVFVVGNTVIDSLFACSQRAGSSWPRHVPEPAPGQRMVLVTLHRRENFGPPLEDALTAIRLFAEENPSATFVYPVHPNPNVKNVAGRILGSLANVHLVEPLDYPAMVAVLSRSYLVLTDSGGLQEEGPALGKPVLVLREVTERPEAVEAGGAILVGTNPEAVLRTLRSVWNDSGYYAELSRPRFPFGQGDAAIQIADHLEAMLQQATKQSPKKDLPATGSLQLSPSLQFSPS